ncbi:MAG: MFS transporter [SAR202 cluster bacterium]|nr:MFS transporter [SAR202 cluster bacterium]
MAKSADHAGEPPAWAAVADDFPVLPRRQIIITMGGVMLALFLAALDQTIVGTAMPRIIADLGEFGKFTWVTTAYLVTSTAIIPVAGKFSDIYGRKIFFLIGVTVFLLGSVLAGLSGSMNQLILSRALQGLGGGVLFANAFIAVGDLFPPADRAKYLGFIAAIFGIASLVGPVLGGFITDALSWHWVFFINVPIGIPVILLFIRFFPNAKREAKKRRLDYFGIALLLVGVSCLILGLSWGGSSFPWSSPQVIVMFVVAAICTVAFIFWEQRAADPVMPLGIYKNPIVAVSVLAVFFSGFGMFAGPVFVPLYFQGVLGESPTSTGSILTPMMLGTVVGASLAGQLMSRLRGRYKYISLIGLAILGAGLYLSSQMDLETNFGTAILNIILMGFGLGMSLPTYSLAVQNAVSHANLGVVTSAVQFVRSIGGTVGLAVLGSVMASRFASNVAAELGTRSGSSLTPDLITEISGNPRVLVDEEALTSLESTLTQSGANGMEVSAQIVHTLREVLSWALHDVFLVTLGVTIVAIIVTAFLKEIPFRTSNATPAPAAPGAGESDSPPTGMA